MSEASKKEPYTIVVGADFSETGALAIERAFEIASREPNAIPHVVSVAGVSGPMLRVDLPNEVALLTMDQAGEELKTHVSAQLDKYKEKHGAPGFEHVVTHVRIGGAAEEIAQLASDLDADLVVVGTHGRRGAQRFLLGSVAEVTIRMAHCPVLVVRPKDHGGGVVVPEIEPPCPRCVEARKKSSGEQLWCAQHGEKHGRRHTYHYVDRNTAAHENMGLTVPQR